MTIKLQVEVPDAAFDCIDGTDNYELVIGHVGFEPVDVQLLGEPVKREFTYEDRKRVKDVLDCILDEMGDSYTLQAMFKPYAEIVQQALTDQRITESLADSGYVEVRDESEDAQAKLNALRDYNA